MTDYNSFRDSKGLANSDIIRAVRTKYPRYSKAQNSMINNPEKNGVCLLPEAEKILEDMYGPGPGLSISKKATEKKRNHENKDKPHRLCVRLSKPMMEQVKALMERMCFATTQDFIEAAVQQMLERYGG